MGSSILLANPESKPTDKLHSKLDGYLLSLSTANQIPNVQKQLKKYSNKTVVIESSPTIPIAIIKKFAEYSNPESVIYTADSTLDLSNLHLFDKEEPTMSVQLQTPLTANTDISLSLIQSGLSYESFGFVLNMDWICSQDVTLQFAKYLLHQFESQFSSIYLTHFLTGDEATTEYVEFVSTVISTYEPTIILNMIRMATR